jgi:DNA-binding PadR family transcriptional regulator
MITKTQITSWILRGSQRRVIFRILKSKKMIPAEMYEKATKINSKITRNSVSDVLREFKKKGLVKCINPEESKGRIYEITTLGKDISKEI